MATAPANRLISLLRSPRALALGKGLVAVTIAVIVLRALKGYREALAGRMEHVNFAWLALALGLCALYRVVNAYGWVLVLRSLGHPMPAVAGVRTWLVSETMRWLPGSVWSFFSRVAQATRAGVPSTTASLSLPLELLLTIAAWSVVALAGVGVSGTAGAWLSRLPALWMGAFALGLLLTIGAAFALAHFAPAASFTRKLRGLEGSLRQLRDARPRLGPLGATLALFIALGVVNGVTFFAVLRATCATPPSVAAAVGINAAGWLLGFFAFFAPAGLGVREGAMAAMLTPLMPVDAALAGVLLWRLIQIVAELICLAVALLAAPTARRLTTRTPSSI